MINDGGPAYPVLGFCVDANGALCGEIVKSSGMSIRDAFAMAALTGIIARQSSDDFCRRQWIDDATSAFDVADAMLKAREANNGQA